jgi:hypothetical protein
MNKLKSTLCILLLLICSVAASAHSGGTDANGGHWNHKTGEYHYHHGYSAHQHPGGVCPYDTSTSSSNQSSSSSKSSSSSNSTSKSPSSSSTSSSSVAKQTNEFSSWLEEYLAKQEREAATKQAKADAEAAAKAKEEAEKAAEEARKAAEAAKNPNESDITITYGVSLVLDGKKVTLADASGNEVKPFVYEGTTYVPLRAVSQLFDATISYDATTNTVYLTSPIETVQKEKKTIGFGSTQQDVIDAMGMPDNVEVWEGLGCTNWYYGTSMVEFKNSTGLVRAWETGNVELPLG